MLRCRKGDMAIVLRNTKGIEGCLVDVKEYIGVHLSFITRTPIEAWRVEHRGDTYYVGDRFLLPIRPGDLDETEETSKELEMAK